MEDIDEMVRKLNEQLNSMPILRENINEKSEWMEEWNLVSEQYNKLNQLVNNPLSTIGDYREILNSIKMQEKQFQETIKQDEHALVYFSKTTITNLIRFINKVVEGEWGDAIKDSIRANKKGEEETVVESKEKKMIEARNKVLALEEFLFSQKEKIRYIGKELKGIIKEAKRAYKFSREFGDQFFT